MLFIVVLYDSSDEFAALLLFIIIISELQIWFAIWIWKFRLNTHDIVYNGMEKD